MSTGKVVNCKRFVNVRRGPGTRYAIIGAAPKGAVYTVIGRSGSWYKIDFNGRPGWISAIYLSVSAAPAPAPTGGTAPAPTGGTAPAPTGGTAPAPTGGTAPAPTGGTAPAPATSSIIAGYYTSWAAYSGYTPQSVPADMLTHIMYAFAKVNSSLQVEMGDANIDASNFVLLGQVKSRYPGLKTLISIGGWEGSGRFSDAALTDASRLIFADSAVAFMIKHGFDGVDIDWEYPTGGGMATNVSRPQDKQNFSLLMAALRQKLDAQGAADGKHYLLTFAGASQHYYADSTELSKLASYVDYAFLMAYDIHGTWESYTDFNAPLYAPLESSPQSKWSCDDGVKLWQQNGVPLQKIVMGTPFYGTMYSGVTNAGNGLYQKYSSGASITYDQVAQKYISNLSYKRFVHADALVPWLFNGSVFITYDDADSIAQKAAYVKQKGLAGIGIWELSQNTNGTLLSALNSRL